MGGGFFAGLASSFFEKAMGFDLFAPVNERIAL